MKTTLSYEEIPLSYSWEFEQTLHKSNEELFGKLSGDTTTSDIVHGMLAGNLFSTLLDMHYPGPETVYVSQTLEFRKPLFYEMPLVIRGTILEKSDTTKIIKIKTEILSNNTLMISGEAKVTLPQ